MGHPERQNAADPVRIHRIGRVCGPSYCGATAVLLK